MKKIIRLHTSLRLLLLATIFTGCLKEDVNNAIGTPSPLISVEVMRNLYKGADLALTPANLMGAHLINGTVLTDTAGRNATPNTLVVQNYGRGAVRGITLAFDAADKPALTMGDSVLIDLTGGTLKSVHGSLQIVGLKSSAIAKLATNATILLKQTTLSALATSFAQLEGTLVQVNADITPTPANGEAYAGDYEMFAGSHVGVYLHTLPGAAFAANHLPASATFTGIPSLYNDKGDAIDSTAQKLFSMRNLADAINPSGPLYAGYPEDFESPDATQKGSYNMTAINNIIQLKTGDWQLYQAILGNTQDRDRFNPSGKQCIRMQQNLAYSGYVQMMYDLPYGASKVTLSYGAYYTDASSTWRLEYSTDGGTTWQQTGSDISDAGPAAKVATFLMNISGPVRFRVNKLGLGTTNGTSILNGRLSIDDIAIYQN